MFERPLIPLQQHRGFAAALQACGQSPLILPGRDPVLVTQRRLWPGVPVAMISRGRLSAETLPDQLRATSLQRTLIVLSPDRPDPSLAQMGAVPLVSPTAIAEIDLRQSATARRRALKPKWRNRLTRAESTKPLHTAHRSMPLDAAHWLFRANTKLQKQRGFRAWPTALTLAYARENPGQARLFTAYDNRDPVAAMLFLRHGDGATYHIGCSTEKGRQLSAHNLLLWRACNWLADHGHKHLDLGMLNTEDAPGLSRFKLGAGATPRLLGGTWVWWPPMRRLLRPIGRLDRRLMRPPAPWTEAQGRVI
jgi:Acetyltransferase (GNAT) domain